MLCYKTKISSSGIKTSLFAEPIRENWALQASIKMHEMATLVMQNNLFPFFSMKLLTKFKTWHMIIAIWLWHIRIFTYKQQPKPFLIKRGKGPSTGLQGIYSQRLRRGGDTVWIQLFCRVFLPSTSFLHLSYTWGILPLNISINNRVWLQNIDTVCTTVKNLLPLL